MWLLEGTPYDVQTEALRQSEDFPLGFAYFMEMGLGKTAVLLADFQRLRKADLVDVLVLLCPNSLKGNWEREVALWTNNLMISSVWPKTDVAHVYIMNYEALGSGRARGKDLIWNLINQGKRVMLGLDESTQIKGHRSNRTKVLLGLARSVDFTRILSGAPMVQGPQDIWPQMKFVGELKGVNFFQFRNRYCQMGGYMGKKITGPRADRIPELNHIIDGVAFRAKKEDWLDLPSKMYYTRELKLNSNQKKHYHEMLRQFCTKIQEQQVDAHMVITQMLKLQQISSGFVIDGSGKPRPIEGPNAKIMEIKSILDNEINSKVIVPVYFKYSVSQLFQELGDYGVTVIEGGMTDEEIESAKRLFNEHDEFRVIICQQSAAKYGHTLLGTKTSPCHTTIFYENTFSLDDRIQMEDRNHRIGQEHIVNCIDLISTGVEQKVIAALQHKRNIAETIIDAIRTERI